MVLNTLITLIMAITIFDYIFESVGCAKIN